MRTWFLGDNHLRRIAFAASKHPKYRCTGFWRIPSSLLEKEWKRKDRAKACGAGWLKRGEGGEKKRLSRGLAANTQQAPRSLDHVKRSSLAGFLGRTVDFGQECPFLE